MIEAKLRSRGAWAEIKFRIDRIDENERGENFEVYLLETESGAGPQANFDFNNQVILELKSHFMLA